MPRKRQEDTEETCQRRYWQKCVKTHEIEQLKRRSVLGTDQSLVEKESPTTAGRQGMQHQARSWVMERGRKKNVFDMSWVDSNRTVCIVMHKGRNKDSAIATWKGMGCWMS